MKRSIRLCLLSLFFVVFALAGADAAKIPLSETIGPNDVKVLLKDNTYFIDQTVLIKGTLIIEPGTIVEFYTGGRLIVGTGGRLIADGFARLDQKTRPGVVSSDIQGFFGENGYADMRCFMFPALEAAPLGNWNTTAGLAGTNELGVRERTVNPSKYNHIFNVAIDVINRKIVNIENPYDATWPVIDLPDPNGAFSQQLPFNYKEGTSLYVVPFETAIMFAASRLEGTDAISKDPLLKTTDWQRANQTSVNVTPATITFIGQPQNEQSTEYGHIIVLPGARAAFFRNCDFRSMKKDITVDNKNFYVNADVIKSDTCQTKYVLSKEDLSLLNAEMIKLTNGGGGAITTFSSRTWIVDCDFTRNFARLRGGAVQILQAPTRFFYPDRIINPQDTAGIARFVFNNDERLANARVTDHDATTSTVLTRNEINYPRYPRIDRIDENYTEEFASDLDRMAWDDARLAGYLGRYRNLTFTENMVRLANAKVLQDENNYAYYGDDTSGVVSYPFAWGDSAVGGAMYIAGTEDNDFRQIEFGLGINESIRLGLDENKIVQNPNNLAGESDYRDYIRFEGNSAQNLQSNKLSGGAKGGAIYVGKNTSLIVAGEFINNFTHAKWLVDTTGTAAFTTNNEPTPYINGIQYSSGGAIYSDPVSGRLQIRGDLGREEMNKRSSSFAREVVKNTTLFDNNRAGSGGAVFVNRSNDVFMSPYIGGSNINRTYNNYGYRIQFHKNYAHSAGGAIYTERNMAVSGAGGPLDNYRYSLAHVTLFDSNAAGFAGGAIHIEIPEDENSTYIPNTRIVNFERAQLEYNTVNKAAFLDNAHINNKLVDDVRGGGALYVRNASLNVVKSTFLRHNATYNSNGGGIAIINPCIEIERMFVTDLDVVRYAEVAPEWNRYEGLPLIATDYISVNNPFTYGANSEDGKYNVQYPDEYWTDPETNEQMLVLSSGAVRNPDSRMLTRLENNWAEVNDSIAQHQLENYGNTQISSGYIMPNTYFNTQWWFNADKGFLAGTNGWLNDVSRHDESGDILWSEKYNDSLWKTYSFTDAHFNNETNGYLSDNHGFIYKYTKPDPTTPYTVTAVTIGTEKGTEGITDMSFIGIGADRGIAVTEKGKIFTTENGADWTEASFTNWGRRLNGVHIVNANLAYAVGSDGSFIRMTREGNSWVFETIAIPGLTQNLNKVYFTSPTNGYVIGEQGIMLVTADGGNTWKFKSGIFGTGESLTSIAFYIGDIGYVTTSVGSIYKTTTSGDTWTKLDTSFTRINSVFVYSQDVVFVAGENDLVERSTDGGATWTSMQPTDKAKHLGNPRLHGKITNLVENGVGLGGAIYVLDYQNLNRNIRRDDLNFNRVRIQDNFAFSGSAIYSDNYNLKLIFNRSLVRGNRADTKNYMGREQNLINGPYNKEVQTEFLERNYASSDLVAATIYGEVEGPFPTSNFSTHSNSIYDNEARFLIRLPDAPNTKGMLSGQNENEGYTGINTMKGNFWGHTEANVGLFIMNRQNNHARDPYERDGFMTFFVEKKSNRTPIAADTNYLPFYNKWETPVTYPVYDANGIDWRKQGPFEYNSNDYDFGGNAKQYAYISLDNMPNTVADYENLAGAGTIPEKYLFSYDIYDKHDKGVDIKLADYSQRRLFPIEDFAVGNPSQIFIDHPEYYDIYDNRGEVKREKYVKRWVLNPEYANDITDVDANNEPIYTNPTLHAMQSTWRPMKDDGSGVPKYYHPLGMPLYLEARARIYEGDYNTTNRDLYHQASSVFFVINENTLDYIRVELKQLPTRRYDQFDSIVAIEPVLRGTVFFVPDDSERKPAERRKREALWSLGSNGSYPFGGDPFGKDDDAGVGGAGSPELLKALSPRAIDANTTHPGIDVAAKNEDFAALHGRKYGAISSPDRIFFNLGDPDPNKGQKIAKLFTNRPDMPEDNDTVGAGSQSATHTTFYGGERYGTLPVNVGDVIRVVSRNVLWRQGPVKAFDGGLVFIVKEGPEVPEFTGDITMWDDPAKNPYVTDSEGNYPIEPGRVDENGDYTKDTVRNHYLLNKIWVRTNREYPWNGTGLAYSDASRTDNDRGTDFILTATAFDRNNFYDPRNNIWGDRFSGLIYDWRIAETSPDSTGLRRWLMVDKKTEDIEVDGQNHKGYLRFKGYPINPYIIPGGEKIQVTARNFAPGIDMLDSIKTETQNPDTLAWFYTTFPPYLSSPKYNESPNGEVDMVARYLQQDTMGARSGNLIASKEISIFVMDSLPRFIDYRAEGTTDAPTTFQVKAANYDALAADTAYAARNYDWTRFIAGTTNYKRDNSSFRAKYLVNLAGIPDSAESSKLRFTMDLNTDDELEDLAAEQTVYPAAWHFPYGRSAYSFHNVAINGGDTVGLDTNYNTGYDVSQLKPNWMDYQYFMQFSDYTLVDPTLLEFQRRGQINLRIPEEEALELLRRGHLQGEQYNLDTMMAIVCNDGHGGSATTYIPLYVNIQPRIVTELLQPATENVEYNLTRDTIRAIRIYDPNKDQRHTFSLIYAGDPRASIALDPKYPDETTIILTDDMKRTPTWLKIDPVSGVLYGIPGILTDLNDSAAKVTVLVEDEDGLLNIKTLDMSIGTGLCPPKILALSGGVDCVSDGQDFSQDVIVWDRDLIREGTQTETLTMTVTPAWLSITPSTIVGGAGHPDTDTVLLEVTGAFDYSSIVDGYLPITITVTDAAGLTDSYSISLRVSEPVDFLSELTVTNSLGHSQTLLWGTAVGATTGNNSDGAGNGVLDARFCEIEIPPLPEKDVFDARWSVPTINGLYRNIYPRITGADRQIHIYIGTFQGGGVNSDGSSTNYPITLSWRPASIPTATDAVNPTSAAWYLKDAASAGNVYFIGMRDASIGTLAWGNSYLELPSAANDNVATLTIPDNTQRSFHISYESHVSIEDETDIFTTEITNVTPAPMYSTSEEAAVSFNLAKSGVVSMDIYDMLGNNVMTITNAYYPAGSNTVNFNLSDSKHNGLASGVYTIRLTAGVEIKTHQFVVVQ